MTKCEFIKKLNKCRKLYKDAENSLNSLFEKLEYEFDTDLSNIQTNAENADELEEAICCFAQYGEYDAESIWEELEAYINADITD